MSNIFKLISVRDIPVVISPPIYLVPKEPETKEQTDTAEADAATAALLLESVGTETVVEAHQTAKGIIETSKQEAEAIITAANEQSNQLKLDAYDQGYRDGYQEGLAKAQQTIDDATGQARQITEEAAFRATQTLLASERQIVAIALAVARKILNREIAENPSAILPIISAALDKVRDQEKVTIRVSPEDIDLVNLAKTELQTQLTQDSTLSIVDDAGLKTGDCVVETAFGVIDARVDSQYETIKSSLQEAANE